jgi:uncharacterized protein (DUF58 family)
MIVPRDRLLLWTGGVLLPAAALAGALPPFLPAAIAALFVAAVAADAWMARRRAGGLAIEIPDVVRLALDRPGVLPIVVRNTGARARRIRLGLPLPRSLETPASDAVVDLPGADRARLSWACTPRRRGVFRLERAVVETGSPLGWWALRRSLRAGSEIRVYPDLLAERPTAAALFLHRPAPGAHARRQVGKGREFEKLREYIPGDGFEDIHWKATAKRGHPVTRVYQIERTQEVYAAVDASRLAARPGARGPAIERTLRAALLLALAARRQGDRFGLLVYADRVRRFVRAGGGRRHFDACREALATVTPEPVTPDYDDVAAFLRTRLRRRALLVFLTDLEDPALAEAFVRGVDLIRRQHLVQAHMLRPPAARPLFSDPAVADRDGVYRALAGHLAWRELRDLQRTLQARGVRLAILDEEALCPAVVGAYLDVKRRQVL